MKNVQKGIHTLLQTAFITLIVGLVMTLFAGLWQSERIPIPNDITTSTFDAYVWKQIKLLYIPSYLQSIAILVTSITLFRLLLLVEKTLVQEQIEALFSFGNDLPAIIGMPMLMVILLGFIAQAITFGIVTDYQVRIPGVSVDTAFYIALGLAAFFGLCGRGAGLTYVVLTAGIAGFMSGEFLTDYVFFSVVLFIAAFAGYIPNRIIYFLFVKKHDFNQPTTA